MKKGYWLIILVLTLACNRNSEPDNLLSRDKMEDVLWDMMRADLFINNYMVIKDANLNKQQQGVEFYTQILKLHKVSQEQFKTSFEYYRSQPDEMKVLMDSLSHRSDTAAMSKPTKTPVADSMPKPDIRPVPPADTTRKSRFPRSKAE
jgi:hypothetical protein